jgi:GNAT superfamily N-acetyltransferase
MPNISLASIDDIESCVNLLCILFEQEADFTPAPEKHRAGLLAILAQPQVGRLYCAREDTGVVGMVSLLFTISTALGAPVAWLEDLVVAPTHRGHGLGEQLLTYALADAKQQGLARVSLLTDKDNHAAHRLYARTGFEQSHMVAYRLLMPAGTPTAS